MVIPEDHSCEGEKSSIRTSVIPSWLETPNPDKRDRLALTANPSEELPIEAITIEANQYVRQRWSSLGRKEAEGHHFRADRNCPSLDDTLDKQRQCIGQPFL